MLSSTRFRRWKGEYARTWMVVKLTVLLLIGFLQAGANVYSQDLTLSLKEVPIEKVFKEIQKQTVYRFFYNERLLEQTKRVTLHVRNASIETVLAICFKDQPVAYEIDEKQIVVKLKEPMEVEATRILRAISQPPFNITGRITDEQGAGVSGASIKLKGTEKGTAADASGNFTIQVPESGGVLLISSVGFQNYELTVSAARTVTIVLKAEESRMNEVVVVGYGRQKKVSLTSAVSEIKGEELTRRPVTNVAQALQGQVPGLTILDQGGGPGKPLTNIRIRGVTTLSGDNSPLVIVDGIEQNFSDINPTDIESISVLKDASSTAIYGSRAANGVMLITTKRARVGKVAVSYNGFYAVQKSVNFPEHMGLEDYMRMQNVAYQNVGSPPKYTEQQIMDYVNATDRYKFPLPYTMAEAVLSPAPQINHSLSVSGGTENFKTRLSLRYQDQEGIIPNSNSKLSEIRINNDFKVSSKIKIGTDLNYRHVNSLAPSNEFSVFERLKHGSIWTVPKYPDGTYGISAQGQNALMYAEIHGTTKPVSDYVFANIKGDWEIVKGLTFTTQYAVRMNFLNTKTYLNSYKINDYYNPAIVRRTVPLNSLTETRDKSRESTLNYLLNYSTTIGKHFLNVLTGYSEIKNNGNLLNAYRQGFYNNDIQSIGQGTDDNTKSNGGAESQWGLRSYFGRLNYTFQDKYLVEMNGRYDGSSRFTKSNRYSFFPSFSAGWRVSQEKFWGNADEYVNEFKVRGSWGKTGNQAVALYSYFPTLNQVNYTYSGAPVQGYIQQRMTNEDISWETTTQYNIGLDAMFLNSKISFSADYYNKRTDGILLVLPVPGTLGLQATAQNAGTVNNKGWEFTAGTHTTFNNFRLDANFNLSINKNNVVNLAGTGPYITSSENNTNNTEAYFLTGEGYPINSLWGYKTAGLFQNKDEILHYPTIVADAKPGDRKYLDLNNDGKINADDMTFLGATFPKYTFGAAFNLTYKGFALNVLFQGAADVYTAFSGSLRDMGNLEGFTHKIYTNNYWTPENPGARFPRPTKSDLRNEYQSDGNVIDASYIRMKNIQLGYQVPSSLSRKLYIDRMNVYVSGTNLLTLSKLNEWNLDPESSPGRVQYYPQTSLYTVGVNLQF